MTILIATLGVLLVGMVMFVWHLADRALDSRSADEEWDDLMVAVELGRADFDLSAPWNNGRSSWN